MAAFPNIGCYVGVPVVLLDGTFLGTLCAVDPEPQHITQPQVDILAVLSRIVATSFDRDRELRQRDRAERQLRQQLQYTKAITSSLRSGLYVVDRRGHLTYMNPAAESALGWSEAELMGTDMHE
ncbi:MAG: hypothetical protein AVDCRST_MAG93-2448, partial [uncultured Chloroflexia bacterium]